MTTLEESRKRKREILPCEYSSQARNDFQKRYTLLIKSSLRIFQDDYHNCSRTLDRHVLDKMDKGDNQERQGSFGLQVLLKWLCTLDFIVHF